MKIFLALLLIFPSLAIADGWTDNGLPEDSWKYVGDKWSWYEPWRTQDTVLESFYLAVTTVDLFQTHQIVEQHNREVNLILGSHPSMARVNVTILSGMLLHYEVARALPQLERGWFQYFFIGVEITAVRDNYSVGLHTNF